MYRPLRTIAPVYVSAPSEPRRVKVIFRTSPSATDGVNRPDGRFISRFWFQVVVPSAIVEFDDVVDDKAAPLLYLSIVVCRTISPE